MKVSTQTPVKSIVFLSEELLRRGYKMDVNPFHKHYRVFTAPNGQTWTTHAGMLTYPFVSRIAYQVCKLKPVSHDYALHLGINVPKSIQLPADAAQIDTFLESYQPLVVKPHNGYGSHGLTLEVRDRKTLDAAIEFARKYSKGVLVQQQFEGSEVRFTIVKGRVVSCLHRASARVTGNGVSTLEQLIQHENDDRLAIHDGLHPYSQLVEELITEDIGDMQRVPASGELVLLGRSSVRVGGASVYDVSAMVDESYKETALMLATALNKDFLVVDLLIHDYTQPRTDDNYVFLEGNTSPSLWLYYGVRGKGGYDIVPDLVDMVDAATGNTLSPAGGTA